MKVGYARVSTKDQNLALQCDALKKEECEIIFEEKVSGASRDRPALRDMMQHLRQGDIVVIWKLDRLGRSLADLVRLVEEIESKGAGLKSLNDSIDTSTSQGKLTFHLFAALAEFEREIIVDRTKAGLTAARARGRVGGRPKGLSKKAQDKAMIAESLYRQQKPVKEICEHLHVSKSTLYRYLDHRGVQVGSFSKNAASV